MDATPAHAERVFCLIDGKLIDASPASVSPPEFAAASGRAHRAPRSAHMLRPADGGGYWEMF